METTDKPGQGNGHGDEESPKMRFAKGRGKDTLFRVTMQNQIDLVGIADNKANMIISINTILISLAIALLSSGFRFQDILALNNSQLVAPLSLLMIFCLVSAVFAILAARPKIIKKDKKNNNLSPLFFGNFYQQPLNDYLQEINEVLVSNELIYRNLTIDMYNNGQVLNKKYKHLHASYTLFMIGIIVCVVTYFVLFAVNR